MALKYYIALFLNSFFKTVESLSWGLGYGYTNKMSKKGSCFRYSNLLAANKRKAKNNFLLTIGFHVKSCCIFKCSTRSKK
jgi:hypothetical protein